MEELQRFARKLMKPQIPDQNLPSIRRDLESVLDPLFEVEGCFKRINECCKEEKYERLLELCISGTARTIPFKFDTQGNKTVGQL